jgi:hypothetical protein
MRKPAQTFRDPQTGQEIESTALARWGARLAVTLVVLLILSPIFGLVGGLVCELGWCASLKVVGVVCVWVWVLVWVLFDGLVYELFGRLGDWLVGVLYKEVYDNIARRQHLRPQIVRQRKRLRAERLFQQKRLEAEWAGVPAGAISRAQPPGDPQPTAASLSRADGPKEGPPRLAAGVDAVTEADEPAVVWRRR